MSRRLLRDEGGFSLVELLVTMLVFIVVLSATLTAFEAFGRSAKSNTDRGDAQDAARNTVDQIASTLRNAVGNASSPGLELAGPTDLVFQQVDAASAPPGQNASDLMRVRYCLDASDPTNEKLYRQTQHWSTAAAPALPSTSSCPGVAPWDAGVLVLDHVVNPVPSPTVFTYGPGGASQLSSIAQVGMTFYVDRDPAHGPPAAVLSTLVALRNVNRAPAVTLTCSALGGGAVLCDSTGTADPDGQPLTYAWQYGTSCSSLTTISGATGALLNKGSLSPGVSYCFGFTATDPGGQSASATTTVTAR